MFQGTIKFFNPAVIKHLNKLTSIRNYAPRRRRPSAEESDPGINKRVQYFKEDMIANEDPEVIVSKQLILSLNIACHEVTLVGFNGTEFYELGRHTQAT